MEDLRGRPRGFLAPSFCLLKSPACLLCEDGDFNVVDDLAGDLAGGLPGDLCDDVWLLARAGEDWRGALLTPMEVESAAVLGDWPQCGDLLLWGVFVGDLLGR